MKQTTLKKFCVRASDGSLANQSSISRPPITLMAQRIQRFS